MAATVTSSSISILIPSAVRLLFHPLRSVPGPWINSISEAPAAFALITGNQHLYYRSLHDKYGPVVRVSPNELSFISPDAREEIYGLRKGGLNMEKSPIFLGAVGSVDGQTGVSLAVNKEHARQRRALGYLFTNSALLRLESVLQDHTQKLIDILKRRESENRAVDVSDWYTYLAFDLMGDLCFAEPFGCLDQGSATEWSTSVISIFVDATYTQAIRRISGVGTLLERLLTRVLIPSQASVWRSRHLANAREKTLARLADPDRDHTDFIYQILHSESSKSLSQTEIVLNMALFISAGTDTTATALTGWTYFVCTHPEAYRRLVAEIRGGDGTGNGTGGLPPRWETVKCLRYLDATVREALRLFPPSPASQQRVVPHGGATIDGYYVPAGTTVAVAPWVATHSRLNFCEPDAFRPERWLGESSGEGRDDDAFAGDRLGASLPFGTGPRVCIGRNLAYMEMRLVAAHLLWNFDVELEGGDANVAWGLGGRMRPMKVFHSMTKPPLWVRLTGVRG
ncbi:cytochrome P450 [Microdochium trichocladiopsis]|uniref:Cytochrome P450 n=1 Tax=Microdochium trichocladiopsis TaxID=1682393 RepID=A0A9P8Y2C3_9PEZI|nr:cytochrome P450 [Microdochium trichocladiopsis]KAH7027179.1 cytochrome P450 [Microdochium trichocladiopsis]